jgi:hypothetical protein
MVSNSPWSNITSSCRHGMFDLPLSFSRLACVAADRAARAVDMPCPAGGRLGIPRHMATCTAREISAPTRTCVGACLPPFVVGGVVLARSNQGSTMVPLALP